jgi:hypothetical protein
MNYHKTLKHGLVQKTSTLIIGLCLVFTLLLANSGLAQALPDVHAVNSNIKVSTAKQDENDVSHYPEWYRDRQGIETPGKAETGVTKDYSRNPVMERTQQQIKERNREKAEQPKSGFYSDQRDNNDVSLEDAPERIGNIFEKAKDTFSTATEAVKQGETPLITGEPSR